MLLAICKVASYVIKQMKQSKKYIIYLQSTYNCWTQITQKSYVLYHGLNTEVSVLFVVAWFWKFIVMNDFSNLDCVFVLTQCVIIHSAQPRSDTSCRSMASRCISAHKRAPYLNLSFRKCSKTWANRSVTTSSRPPTTPTSWRTSFEDTAALRHTSSEG